MYEVLGRLPRLRRVVLQFDWPRTRLLFSKGTPSWEKLRAFVGDLIDIAVDETLVRAIIRKITAGKCPLERLKIGVRPFHSKFVRIREPYRRSYGNIAGLVAGRSWLCTRDDGESAQMEVREITKASALREAALDHLKGSADEYTRELWAGVWPPREGDSEKWWENWWSYPLADITDDGEEGAGSAGPDM
ncbi:hypothetical protein QBC40DRAFT_249553 [Triangularia verruculosa]|uniref:Uncharacterized protein n=1 Tax=Triangularia verruculosa TaxID=2587418 RepID=A0AAN7B0C2_9PEZI|nr:hypothetical protein QBC40DRAFT_249553 [Triangularia verruculosa]